MDARSGGVAARRAIVLPADRKAAIGQAGDIGHGDARYRGGEGDDGQHRPGRRAARVEYLRADRPRSHPGDDIAAIGEPGDGRLYDAVGRHDDRFTPDRRAVGCVDLRPDRPAGAGVEIGIDPGDDEIAVGEPVHIRLRLSARIGGIDNDLAARCRIFRMLSLLMSHRPPLRSNPEQIAQRKLIIGKCGRYFTADRSWANTFDNLIFTSQGQVSPPAMPRSSISAAGPAPPRKARAHRLQDSSPEARSWRETCGGGGSSPA